MKIGKVPESVLKRSVIKQLHTKREEVVLGAGVGEDCAALTLAPDEMFVMSTDPITGTVHEIGKLAILITTNDLASAGAEPIGVMLTILLPEHTEESLLKQLMQELEEAAAADDVVIINRGRIVAQGTPDELREQYSTDVLRIFHPEKELRQYLQQRNMRFSERNTTFEIEIREPKDAMDVLHHIEETGITPVFEMKKGTLDDVFLNVVEGADRSAISEEAV